MKKIVVFYVLLTFMIFITGCTVTDNNSDDPSNETIEKIVENNIEFLDIPGDGQNIVSFKKIDDF